MKRKPPGASTVPSRVCNTCNARQVWKPLEWALTPRIEWMIRHDREQGMSLRKIAEMTCGSASADGDKAKGGKKGWFKMGKSKKSDSTKKV